MSNKNIGYALLGVGGIVLVWAMFIFDTSVAVDAYTRVNNLGLLNDQRNYSLIGGAIAVIGVFLIFKGDNDKSQIHTSNPTTVNPTSLAFSGFTGDKSLDNDAYKIYLSKKYTIEKNDALGKIIVKDKLFGSIDEALRFADSLEKNAIDEALIQTQQINQNDQKERLLNEEARKYNITQIGNKYLYKTYQYDELVDAIVFAKADANSQEPINDTIASATKAEAKNDEATTKSGSNFLVPLILIVCVMGIPAALWYYSISNSQNNNQQVASKKLVAMPAGELSIRNNELLFKGKKMIPNITGNFIFLKKETLPNNGYAVLLADKGGNACPFLFTVIVFYGSNYKASNAFGTCSDIYDFNITDGIPTLITPELNTGNNKVYALKSLVR